MMIMKNSSMSRRTLLRGLGASLALPWLDAMTPAARAAGTKEAPVRMAVLYMPNGLREDLWTPSGEGRDFELSHLLSPLADFKNDLLVPTNLWNQGSKAAEGHYVKTSGFLTCSTINRTLGVDLNANGVSMDQVAAQAAGHKTPIPSLELAIDPVTTGVDRNVGYTRVYGSHIAWSSPATPLARETDPRAVYERMFRAAQPDLKAVKRDRMLLDLVLEDARGLRRQLGANDRQRVDEYLEGVRSLEKRLARASSPAKDRRQPRVPLDPEAAPDGLPDSHLEHVRLMMDMMVWAFQTDTTRISTFMYGNSISNKNFRFLEGVTGGHHSISHHENKEDKLEEYRRINLWHIEQYAYMLGRMKSIREGERSLLDNSMIMFGAGLRDGNKHSNVDLPIVVAGSGGGRLATGQHRVYSENTPLANLFVSMLDAFGTPVPRFADSTGPLQGALA